MGYLFLIISVISGATKGFFAKKVSDRTNGLKSAVISNLIRMVFCIPIGLLFILAEGNGINLLISYKDLFISAFGGVVTSIFIVSWLLAVRKTAYTTIDAFLSMGIFVPILLSLVLYKENISLSQIIGLLLLIFAVMLMSVYSNKNKQKLTVKTLILLIITGVACGLADFSQKMFNYSNSEISASVFNFYIYVFSAITLAITLPFFKNSKKDEIVECQKSIDKIKLLYIAIMAVFLFANTYFKTLAANVLDSVMLYPLSQGLSLLLSLIMSALFFKEKIKPISIIGITVLFVGLLFINVIKF
ncbi:MAG: EamA family transporter [Clostridia bacterium]|nr:EamA family transporter [Clostridia bacterium]